MPKEPENKIREGIIGRYRGIFMLIAFFALLVAGRLFKTTAIDAPHWNAKADSTLLSTVSLNPERGNILAADGSLLAVNVRYYEVRMDFRAPSFDEKDFEGNLDALCDSLSRFSKTPAGKWRETFRKELDKRPSERSRKVLIGKKLSRMEWERLRTFPFYDTKKGRRTLSKTPRFDRVKPYGRMAYRSIGNLDSTGRHGGSGLEKALDSLLFGKPGLGKKVQLANGIRNWEEIAPERGYDIKTTIDVRMQDILETELYDMCRKAEPEWATAVLMEVATGEIKAISNLAWNKTTQDYGESINYALLSWELGSVMKPISLMIAIEDGIVKADDPITIGGSFPYAGARPITDTHGIGANPTVTDVLAGSSNIGTARIITKGFGEQPWQFRKRLEDIGFFDRLNVGLAGEGTPTVLDLGESGMRMDNRWRVNLSRCCYGYAVQLPPVHNLAIINAIANGGVFVRPRLVSELWKKDSLCEKIPVGYVRERICRPEVAAALRNMMRDVIWSKKKGVPTAPLLQNNFVTMAGKTGTARIYEPGAGYSNRLRLTFSGFFPAESPKYSCIVVFNASKTMRGPQYCSGRVAMNVALKMYARGMLGNESDYRNEPDNEDVAATLMGLPVRETDKIIKGLGLKKFKQYPRKDVPEGTVPSVVGMGLREAVAVLEGAGMDVAQVSGSGYVARQIPAAGSDLKGHEKVTLTLTNW